MLTGKQLAQLVKIAQGAECRTRQTDESSALVVLIRICRDYATPGYYPALSGESRDKWLIERRQKYRIKFFEKI